MLAALLVSQMTPQYSTSVEPFYYSATLRLGSGSYVGTGATLEDAMGMADYFAMQQTSLGFTETPPGVSLGYLVSVVFCILLGDRRY